MAFWETMTIAEMNVLLEKKDQPAIKEGWKELAKLIGKADRGNVNRDDKILSDCPLTPAVYFFLCVRKSAGYAEAPLPKRVTIDLSNADDLPQFDNPDKRNNDLAKNSSFLWRVFVKENREMPLYPPTTSLGKLVKEIREDNNKQWNKGEGTQYLMKAALDNLEENFLSQWDETCKKMWTNVLGEKAIDALCEKDPTFKKILDLVEGGVKQIILTGAPGTGKTRAAGLAAQYMGTPLAEYSTKPEYPCPLVQFHPSYDYTDFVEGLRPVQLERQDDGTARQDDGPARFVKLDGSFKAFCRSVARENKARTEDPKNDPDRRYFFLIDEINRADLSKVFGELMFCLEAGKRDRPVQTQYCNLTTYVVDKRTRRAEELKPEDDVFADGFFIPENAIILGTMNDIDRSVESMDFALRRRFVFWEVKVDKEMLRRAFESGGFGQVLKENGETAAERVMALNDVINSTGRENFGLSQQFYISQGQFAGLPEEQDLDKMLQSAWDFRIEPLLREYVRGEDNVESFLNKCAKALRGKPDKQETGQ